MFVLLEVFVLPVAALYYFFCESTLRGVVWGRHWSLPKLSQLIAPKLLFQMHPFLAVLIHPLLIFLASHHLPVYLSLLVLVLLFGPYNSALGTLGNLAADQYMVQQANAIKEGNIEKMDKFSKYFYERIRNNLDAIFYRPLLNILAVSIPFITLLLVPRWFSWYSLLLHLSVTGHIGLLTENIYHWNLHNSVFCVNGKTSLVLQWVLNGCSLCFNYVIGPIFGYVPHVYDITHRLVHHREDNMPEDVQSLIEVDRLSFCDFSLLMFHMSWTQNTGFSAIPYLWRKRYRKALLWMVFGQSGFTLIVLYLCLYWQGFWKPALFYLSHVIYSGFYVSRGIYSWHALVPANAPKNHHTGSMVFLNTKNFLYNDNHHIEHHKRPGAHWSLLPKYFENEKHLYVDANSFDFTLLLKPIIFYLWFQRLDLIAQYYVQCTGPKKTQEEIIDMIKQRLVPLGGEKQYSSFRKAFEALCLKMVYVCFIGEDIQSDLWEFNKG